MKPKDLRPGDLIISSVSSADIPDGTLLEVISIPDSVSKLGIDIDRDYVLVYGPKLPKSAGSYRVRLDVLVEKNELKRSDRDQTKELQHEIMWAKIDRHTIKVPGKW